MKQCPYCTAEIPSEAKKCKHSGEWVERDASSLASDPAPRRKAPYRCRHCGHPCYDYETPLCANCHGRYPAKSWSSQLLGCLVLALLIPVCWLVAYLIFGSKPALDTRDVQDRPDTEKELERLQGTWIQFWRVEGGAQVAGEDKTIKFVITGNQWTQEGGGGQAGIVKIVDLAGPPKKIDLVITDGLNKGKTVFAVYEINKFFMYCGNLHARPASLQTKVGDGSYTICFKRPKE